MLYGRTCKLVEFENATKALEKAKPLKREAVSITLIVPKAQKYAKHRTVKCSRNESASTCKHRSVIYV